MERLSTIQRLALIAGAYGVIGLGVLGHVLTYNSDETRTKQIEAQLSEQGIPSRDYSVKADKTKKLEDEKDEKR